jgi:hypothetical protein
VENGGESMRRVGYPVKEKRKLERFKMHLPAIVTILERSSVHRTAEWPTRDISADGAFLLTDGSVPAGTRVDIEFLMKSNLPVQSAGGDTKVNLKIQGVSVRNDRSGTAVMFDKAYEIWALRHYKPDSTWD